MKTRNLLITLGAAAFAAITISATAGNTYLSPRAAGNQPTHVSGIANDVNTVAVNTATVSPRAAVNQIVTVAGQSGDVNSTVACAKTMTASPKSIQACIQSGTMSGCKPMTVADAK
jgi:ADP-ribosylglycohydrolase